MFTKFVSDGDDREAKYMLSLYSDIDTYQHTEKEKGKNTSKDKQAIAIYKSDSTLTFSREQRNVFPLP